VADDVQQRSPMPRHRQSCSACSSYSAACSSHTSTRPAISLFGGLLQPATLHFKFVHLLEVHCLAA
jgi:hypothetical protein